MAGQQHSSSTDYGSRVVRLTPGEQPPVSSPASRRLLRDHHPLTQWLQWLATIAAVLLTLDLAGAWMTDPLPVRVRYIGALVVLMMVPVYRFFGVFHRFSGVLRGVLRLAFGWAATTLLLAALLLVLDPIALNSYLPLLGWAVAALLAQIGVYLAFCAGMRFWHRNLRINVPCLVIGTSWLGCHLAETLNSNNFIADRVTGMIDDGHTGPGVRKGAAPVLGGLDDLDEILASNSFDRVYIAMPMDRMDRIQELQCTLLRRSLDVIWVPDIFSMRLINPSLREVGGLPLIALSESPLISGPRAYFKALVDVCVGLAALAVFSPVMIVTALAIKLTSPGPVLFRQAREGWDGARFEIFKFRSMYVHDEGAERVTQAHEGDSRITPVGRIIRKLSIDELPQLFNVLGGSMSLVGPRPHAIAHNQEYSKQINAYLARHRIKPGMTGWAQIHGYRGETKTLADMEQRIRYDLEYINRWSLLLDWYVLFMTPIALVRHRGL